MHNIPPQDIMQYFIKTVHSYLIVFVHFYFIIYSPRPYMNKTREIPWKSILANWMRKPRSIVYSRYFPYLPGRIAHHLNIESIKLRKERVKWIYSFITKYDMQEINDRFYE